MLNIEKTLQSVRDLLDRLGKEGVEFTLTESEYSDCIADIHNPNEVYVFLECSIRPNGTFVWWDYDRHKGVCDFDEFRVRIITLTADEYLDKAKDKRKQWVDLCEGTDTPMPDSLAAVVSDMEDKANRLKALLEPDDPPLLYKRDTAILKERDILPRLWRRGLPAQEPQWVQYLQAIPTCPVVRALFYESRRSTVLLASSRMFRAAFTSRSCRTPHCGHVHSLTSKSLVCGFR